MTASKSLAHSDRGLSHELRAKSEECDRNAKNRAVPVCPKREGEARGTGRVSGRATASLTLIRLHMGVGSSGGDKLSCWVMTGSQEPHLDV